MQTINSKYGLSKKRLERNETIERLHETTAYHEWQIEQYEWEINFLEGKIKVNKSLDLKDLRLF